MRKKLKKEYYESIESNSGFADASTYSVSRPGRTKKMRLPTLAQAREQFPEVDKTGVILKLGLGETSA